MAGAAFRKDAVQQCQILDLLALAQAETSDPLYGGTVADTVNWLLRDMMAQAVQRRAAFASSQDADSEGEEGRFYV